VKFTTQLEARPTSLGYDNGYIGVGVADGRILFFSLRSGKKVLQYQAHTSNVRSLYMEPGAMVLSGGDDGVIKRWVFVFHSLASLWSTNVNEPV
jgi:WD40 repeat protein